MALPKPPKRYQDFVTRYPRLGDAWDAINDAGADGPLDEKTRRLIKLAVAVGAMREGAVNSNVRKALAIGIGVEQIEQVVALSAGTLGLPSTVAVFSWISDCIERERSREAGEK